MAVAVLSTSSGVLCPRPALSTSDTRVTPVALGSVVRTRKKSAFVLPTAVW